MAIPEWKLEEEAGGSETYQFSNVNPKQVFLLALVAGLTAVGIVFAGYVAVTSAVDEGYIADPPRLQGLVD